ncbi:MAG: AmmeMemoRadiSam system protein A [Clostridiaceae bacterium]|nr:AmmeMemoRadiSam system protein A [Clostridiaceae bacterium]
MIERGYVAPHPPIILPEVGRGQEATIQNTIDSMKRLATEIAAIKPELIVITSPHAPLYRDGFFIATTKTSSGNLRSFGVSGVELEVNNEHELATSLATKLTEIGIPVGSPTRDSLELDHGTLIPLRFVQEKYTDFKLLRLGISGLSAADHYRVGQKIKEVVAKQRSVFIASGDLSHVLTESGPYGYKPEGPLFDQKIVDILSNADFAELLAITDEKMEQAAQCGTSSFQMLAGALDGQEVKSELYSYEGPFGVGYSVLSFLPGPKNQKRNFLATSEQMNTEQVTKAANPYLELAWQTIDTYINEDKIIDLPQNLPSEMLEERAGVFVTLYKRNKLRGCIGTIEPTTNSIAEEIINNAIAAATRDPRFPAVESFELAELVVSVDVLAEAEPITSLSELDPDNYGVIVSKGHRRGLLLPKLEGINDATTQVEIALQKAGIAADENYSLERFKVVRHE